jgi:NAD(P)-dependent dehydrogenase (short-subunit alcohol dehydrogenase family)
VVTSGPADHRGGGRPDRRPLEGKVAVVAGATRGAGRGIAMMLGEAGATVYCTGRSVKGKLASGRKRPETINETAALVTRHGGKGVAVRVDHTVEEQVATLFKRVRREQGRLDVLVNDVWGGDDLMQWGTPFWQLDMKKGRAMLMRAVWAHALTARHGVPLMVEQGSGLVVEITDGDHHGWRSNLFYDLAKMGAIRMAYSMGADLIGKNVTVVAVTPGYLRSEAMLDRFGVTEDNWRDYAKQEPAFAESETPWFVGRAVAALAADPKVASKSGKVYASWTLAREYLFSDQDGTRPDWGRYFDGEIRRILDAGGPKTPDEEFWLRIGYFHAHRAPARYDEARRIASLLGIDFVVP